MKYALLFLFVTLVVWGYRERMGKRARKRSISLASTLLLPVLAAGCLVFALLFLNLNFNGKII